MTADYKLDRRKSIRSITCLNSLLNLTYEYIKTINEKSGGFSSELIIGSENLFLSSYVTIYYFTQAQIFFLKKGNVIVKEWTFLWLGQVEVLLKHATWRCLSQLLSLLRLKRNKSLYRDITSTQKQFRNYNWTFMSTSLPDVVYHSVYRIDRNSHSVSMNIKSIVSAVTKA